ncbi:MULTISPECIES: hypothetical protein [Clostridia]|uniref:hypothetical protein n=1 Tax=Clostridia TaxID=186801 RepID=UPI000EA35134|nr:MULTISPECIES: hypothetical protein [Clostridia]NBJ70294.1 hypothetical protein [Roseburia sp. 1XD42-34]RKI76433.1 hypothetical protein D7V87_13150 [Clostridium sp. 1xD42-85]
MEEKKVGKKIIIFLKRYSWFVHLFIFIVSQVLFILFDGSKIWMIFHLNDYGKWAVSELHWLFETFRIHEREGLNYVTVVWMGALILHGIACIKNSRKHQSRVS